MPRKPELPSRIQGFGFIYRPRYTAANGDRRSIATWWMRYKVATGEVTKSTGRKDQSEAFGELMKAAGMVASGEITEAAPERVKISQLLEMLLAHYQGKKTYLDVKGRVEKRLRKAFGNMRAVDLKTRDLKAFAHRMLAEGAGPATVNRYFSNLHKAFALGREDDLVLRIPEIPWQREDNIRQGILSDEQYRALRDELGKTAPHARLALVIGYYTGMRKGEMLGLRIDQVDVGNAVIHLESKQTKNRQPRVAPIYGEMRGFIELGIAETRSKYPECPYLIQYRGRRVWSIRTAWDRAAANLGLDGSLVHDLRRTALTNMEEAGIPRHVAMAISGHKTDSAYKRYLIRRTETIKEAGKTMEAFHEQRRQSDIENARKPS